MPSLRHRSQAFVHGVLTLLVMLALSPAVHAQLGPPFVCDNTLYIVTGGAGQSQLYSIDRSQSPFLFTPIGGPTTTASGYPQNFLINGLAYNPVDNYLYAIVSSPNNMVPYNRNQMVRLGPNGFWENLGEVQAPPGNSSGTFLLDGTYLVGSSRRVGRYDVTTSPPTRLSSVTFPSSTRFTDFAVNPQDPTPGRIYWVDENGPENFVKFGDALTGSLDGVLPNGTGQNINAGSQFFDAQGTLYYRSNSDLLVYRIDMDSSSPTYGVATAQSLAPTGGTHDGASCAVEVGFEKDVSPAAARVGDTVTYTYRIANPRSSLAGVSLNDVLDEGRTFIAGTLVNPLGGTSNAFGGTDTLDLTGLTLPANSVSEIMIDVLIGSTSQTTLFNQATLGSLPANLGGSIQSNHPGSPGQTDPTPLDIIGVGLAKQATAAVNNMNGTFTTRLTLRVENLGATSLTGVQITDDLTASFPSPATFSVANVTSSTFSVAAFNGDSVTNLLSGADTLAVGASGSVSFDVTFAPNGLPSPFLNSASVDASGPGALGVSDISDDGSVVDADGDNDPNEAGENDPTPLVFVANPVIGVSKQATPTIDNGNGTFTTTVAVQVTNVGDAPLENVQVTDVLATTFPPPASFSVANLSSPTLSIAPSFDGGASSNLLDATDTLALGATGTVTFDITFDPAGLPSPFLNSAGASAESPFGTPTSDTSDDGTNSDPDGDRNPNEPGENDPTPITFTENPVVGIAKQASASADNGNGTFTTTLTFTLSNLGNVALSNVTAADNLSVTFPAAVAFSVGNLTSATLAVNTGFDGVFDTALLLGGNSLAVGESATVVVDVTFDPSGFPGPFLNSATAVAMGPSGGMTSDTSDDGSQTDADSDGNPDEVGENDPTPISFVEDPVLGMAKLATPTIDNGDGTFTTTVTVAASNLGNVQLDNVQLEDDLAMAFPPPVSFTVSNLTSPLLSTNSSFDGSSVADLLVGTDSLSVGQTASVSFDVTFDPASATGPFANASIGRAQGPGGGSTSDRSDDGSDPDADNDGDPTGAGEDDPTLIGFTENPVLGVAKAAGGTVDNGNGTFTTSLTFTVSNLGNVVLEGVQVIDDLVATFPAPASFSASSPLSSGLAINPGFNGSSDTRLLAGSDSLAVLQSETVTLSVTFDPSTAASPFFNTAVGSASSPGGVITGDRSDEGTDPDSDNDGDPGGVSEDDPTAIAFAEDPVLGVAKAVAGTIDNGNGTFTAAVSVTVENLGNVVLTSLRVTDDLMATFPAPATVSASNLQSSSLTINLSYDGTTDTDLLDGSDNLAVGAQATINFDLTFDPMGVAGPFFNTAIGSAQSAGGTTTSDRSDNGTTPDSDGDGDPGGTGEDDPTPIPFVENPVLGVAKSTAGATDNGNGTFSATVTITLENLGNVVLQSVQATDDLASTFPAPATFTVANVTSPTLAANASYNGNSTLDLLAGSDTLAVGGTATVSFDVTFDPAGLPGPFLNTAIGRAQSPGGQTTSDRSDDGSATDSNGDGDPGNPGEDDPTPITFVEAPSIGAAKTASGTVDNGDGTFTTLITVTLENLGNVFLQNVQALDDLTLAFPSPATFSVANVTSPTLSPNLSFDGAASTSLLLGTDTLAVGETASVSFAATFDPMGLTGPFFNSSTGSGEGAGGAMTTDVSDDGTDPDPSGNGQPNDPGEDDPTPITFVEQPVLGVAKSVTPSTDNGNGTFTTTVTVTLENLGNVILQGVQVTDDLDAVFPAPSTYTVSNVSSATLAADSAFDGSASPDLLAGSDLLPVGSTAMVSFDVTFDPAGLPGPFQNSASGTAQGPAGGMTSDLSDDGSDPDANGNRQPNEAGENDPSPITFVEIPVVGVAKSAGPATDNGNGSFSTTITMTVENLGNVVLENVQVVDDLGLTFPAPATFTVTNVISAQLSANAAFDGAGTTTLLAGADQLAVGQSATVSFDVTFDPQGLAGPFSNSATASASGAGGGVTSDRSDDGNQVDANGNGNPGDPGEDDPTPIAFVEMPVVGVAKAATPTQDNGDGTFTTTITVTVENLGNVVLRNVQVGDDVAAAFPAPATFTVSNLTSPLLSTNPTFDGGASTDLLLGNDSLAVGQRTTVSFDVRFDPGTSAGPFRNTAIGQAEGPGGTPTSDRSDEGNTADADGNGNPADPGEDDPTQIGFVANPVLGVAKSATPTIDNGNGTFSTTFTLVVENLGNVVLQTVQVTDDLSSAFPVPAIVTAQTPSSARLAVNGGFDGLTDQNLLQGTDMLGVGEQATVSFVLTFDPQGLAGPFSNSALASGQSPGGMGTSDRSDDGTDPDPDANGDPSSPGEDDPTPIAFAEDPVLGVAKAVSPTTDNGDGSFTTAVTITLENLGNVVLRNVQAQDDLVAAFPAPATISVFGLSSPLLSVNGSFDGASDIDLLSGVDSLSVGASATIVFDVTFDPQGLAGPFSNQATGSASGPGGTPTSDRSDSGSDPDASGDGDPGGPGEDDPTPITFVEDPVVGTSKTTSASLDNLDGTFTTTVTVGIENLGNVVLSSLSLTDDLAATFSAPATFTVSNLTSAALATNSSFDGSSDLELLAGGSLAVGATASVSFDVTFDPSTLPGPFLNSAIGRAVGPGGGTTSDRSDFGNSADPNGDGDPSVPSEDDPTPIGFIERPVLGVAKAATPTVDNGNGSFTTTVTVTLANLGNVVLTGLQATDDLSSTFPAPAVFSISGLGSATLSTDTAFDGSAVQTLLDGMDQLGVGQSATVSFDVTFVPNGLAGPFLNTSAASATGPGGGMTSDLSDEGSQTDSNGNGDPGDPDENDPTVIGFSERPVLGVGKTVSPAVDNGNGSFTTTVTVIAENLGNVVLGNVQLVDDLNAVFPAPSTFSVANVMSTDIVVNPSFDGAAQTQLAAPGSVLGVGAVATVTFELTFDPNGLPGPFSNSALGSGVGPGGAMTSDRSDNGTDPDPNSDGDPGGPSENDPTPISFTETPRVGAAKAVSPVLDLGAGSFQTTVTLTVQNLGNVVLNSIGLVDDLAAVFPAPATFTVATIASPTLAVNSSFDGASDTELLAGANSLAVGVSATVTFELTFQPNGVAGPFNNTAIARGSGPGGGTTSDRSDSGTNPDASGDGDPSGPGEDDPTAIDFLPQPVLGVAKAATPSSDNGDGSFTTTVTVVVENLGNVILNNVQVADDLSATFPAPSTFSVGPPSSASLSVDTGFDGIGSTNLLQGIDSLAIGESGRLAFDITFIPNGLAGPFNNSALGVGTEPGGGQTTDRSTNGSDPDPNGDGDPGFPGNEDTPTPISFLERAALGVAKEAGSVSDNGDGSFTLSITMRIENLGNVILDGVQVDDDLRFVFPAPAIFSVSNLASATLTVNPGFDGDGVVSLLSGLDSLGLTQIAEVSFDLTVDPMGLSGPFDNVAVASAMTPAGTPVSDVSTDGSEPDPDGNGFPDEAVPTPLPLPTGLYSVPTLGSWALLLFVLLLAGVGVTRLRP